MAFFNLVATHFDGAVKVISPSAPISDHRGFFTPEYREDEFRNMGIPTNFVQDNYSVSAKNVVRGLHYQLYPPMGKLMRVTRGMAWIVTVDLKTLKYVGYWCCTGGSQIWASAEFARGFYAAEKDTEVRYKCTGLFNPEGDKSIRWDDPQIGIEWPIKNPILSERDRNAPILGLCEKLL
jgi:dTDP-4-dehydrorhamnose 3,5-epimerase